jgi:hypothetical protein
LKQAPIYTSRGDWAAMLVNDYYLYNPAGDWIGFLDLKKNVYNVRGEYAGWLSNDSRILRKRDTSNPLQRLKGPPVQPRLKFSPSVPLAPMMAELGYDTIDVFEEMPEKLDPYDMDTVQDID